MTEVVALPPPPPPSSTTTLQPSSSSSPTATTIAHALSEASDTGTPTLTETLSSSIDSQKPNSKVEEGLKVLEFETNSISYCIFCLFSKKKKKLVIQIIELKK